MNRRSALAGLTGTMLVAGMKKIEASGQDSDRDRAYWVQQVLIRMLTVKAGMTRTELLGPFTTEGGVFNEFQRTFVSRDCPYFKVDVTFRAVGRPERDAEGRGTGVEGPRDQIVTISRPYLGFSVMD